MLDDYRQIMSVKTQQNSKENDTSDFSPRLLSAVEQPPSAMPKIMLYVPLTLFVLVLAWAFFGQLDIVTRADGKLVPQNRIKIVQPFEGGRIAKILVRDGDLVKAGQLLMLMDAQLSEADTQKLTTEIQATKLQLKRVAAELEGKELAVNAKNITETDARMLAQYRANRSAYLHEFKQEEAALDRFRKELEGAHEIYEKLQETLVIYQASEKAVSDLRKDGYSSQIEILDKQRARIEAETNLKSQSGTIKSLGARISETREKIGQIKSAYQQKLITEQIALQKQADQLEQDWLKQEYRNNQMELKASEDGFVKDLATNTEGSVVPAGTVLMTLVPVNEPMQAEVFIDNKDIGFIAAGQEAKIKITSYEFQKYGMIDAVVEHVSADASERGDAPSVDGRGGSSSGYRTVLNLSQQFLEYNGKRFSLRPGMRISAEIKMGTRSVVDYILSPIQKTVSEAATEQ